MLSDPSLLSVIIVFAVILAGLFAFLIALDLRIRKLSRRK